MTQQTTSGAAKPTDQKATEPEVEAAQSGFGAEVKRTLNLRELELRAQDRRREEDRRVTALQMAIQAHANDRTPTPGQAITATAGAFETYLRGPIPAEKKPDAPDQP